MKNYCICSMCIGSEEYKQKYKKCIQSHVNFCETHKISYFCTEILDRKKYESELRPESWYKLMVVNEKIDEYEIVFWIDCDVILFNSTLNYFDYLAKLFVKKQKNFMLAVDDGGNMNMGVCVFGHNSRRMIDKMWNQREFIHHPWWENASFIHLYNKDCDFKKQCFVIENARSHILQGYPEHASERAGAVIIHFAGWTKCFLENYKPKFCDPEKIINDIKLSLSMEA